MTEMSIDRRRCGRRIVAAAEAALSRDAESARRRRWTSKNDMTSRTCDVTADEVAKRI